MIISLPAYIEAFLDHKNDDDELEYCLRGQNAIVDMLGFLDIFHGLNKLMLISQGIDVSAWKIVAMIKKLQSNITKMKEDIEKEEFNMFNNLNKYLDDIKNLKFKTATLEPGWKIVKREGTVPHWEGKNEI